MMKFLKILIIINFYFFINLNLLAKTGPETGLNLPRFVSLKSNDVNLRVGPSKNYPILLKYTAKDFPVEIIDEFSFWRKIKDYQKNIGWVHKSLLKGDRFILINQKLNEKNTIHNRPNGNQLGIIENNNIVKLEKCLQEWCYINNKKLKGWIIKENIWGVYSDEIYNLGFLQPLINQYWELLDKYLKDDQI